MKRHESLVPLSRDHHFGLIRAYGVQRVCRVWHRARSSVYARRQATRSPARCRRRRRR